MADLETRLRDLGDRPPVRPTPVADLAPRATRHHRHRVLARATVIVASVLVVTGVSIAALGARDRAELPVVDDPTTTTQALGPPGSFSPPNTDDPNDESYVSPNQYERAPAWLDEYDPAEVAVISDQVGGIIPATALVSTLEFRRACRTLKTALDVALAQPGDIPAIRTVMEPAIALIDERTQYRGENQFAVMTGQLERGETDPVAAQFGPNGSCSRSLVIGSVEPPGGS